MSFTVAAHRTGTGIAKSTALPSLVFSFGVFFGKTVVNWLSPPNAPNQQGQPSLLDKGYNTAKEVSLTVAKVFASITTSLLSVASQEHLVFGEFERKNLHLFAIAGFFLYGALDMLGLGLVSNIKNAINWGPKNQIVKLVETVCSPILKSFSYLVIPQTRRIGHLLSKIGSNFGPIPLGILYVAPNILIPCLIIKIANTWGGDSKIAKLAKKVSSLMLKSFAYSSAIAASACTSCVLAKVLRLSLGVSLIPFPLIQIPTFFIAGALFGGVSALYNQKCG